MRENCHYFPICSMILLVFPLDFPPRKEDIHRLPCPCLGSRKGSSQEPAHKPAMLTRGKVWWKRPHKIRSKNKIHTNTQHQTIVAFGSE